jgi:hypothetical protein
VSASDDAANDALDAAFGTCDTARLHTGDPGSAGTDNVLGTGDDASITFDSATNRSITTTAPASFTNLSASGTVTHVSVWDGSAYRGKAALSSARSVAASASFSINSITFTIP